MDGGEPDQDRGRPAEPDVSTVDDPPADARISGDLADVMAQEAGDPSAREEELETQLRYTLADLENLRRRFAIQLDRERLAERERAARLWIPVLDDFDRAVEHCGFEGSAGAQAMSSVRDQALQAIAELGFPRFDDLGESFDPQRHDAVAAVPSHLAPGSIIQVVRPGYGCDPVVRPASVVVARESDA